MKSETHADREGESSVVASLLSEADTRLSNGQPDDTVQFGYAAVRCAVGAPIDDGLTHWKFYRQIEQSEEAELIAQQLEVLRVPTSGYKRATFDPEPLSKHTATELLDGTTHLCERDKNSDDDDSTAVDSNDG